MPNENLSDDTDELKRYFKDKHRKNASFSALNSLLDTTGLVLWKKGQDGGWKLFPFSIDHCSKPIRPQLRLLQCNMFLVEKLIERSTEINDVLLSSSL